MDLAGDVVQALATFLNVDDLQSTADFPHEMEKLREILVKVQKKLAQESFSFHSFLASNNFWHLLIIFETIWTQIITHRMLVMIGIQTFYLYASERIFWKSLFSKKSADDNNNSMTNYPAFRFGWYPHPYYALKFEKVEGAFTF